MAIVGILIYIVILIIQPQEFIPFFQGMPVSDIIIPLTLGAGIFGTWSGQRRFWVPQHALLLLFLTFVFLSNALNGKVAEGSTQFIIYLKRSAVYLMVFLALNSPAWIKKTLWWLILIITILSIEGMDHFQSGVGWAGQPFAEGRITWIGNWDGSNGLALLFIIAAALALEFGFGPYARGMGRLFYVIALCLLLPGIVLTNSRGGGLSLCLVGFLFFVERYRRYAVRASICVLLVAGLLFAIAPSRMKEVNTKEESARERLWSWEQGLRFLREKPLYGIGKGQFGPATKEGLIAHNNYVQIASEVGWIGYLIWLAIPYLSLKGCYFIYRQEVTTREQTMLVTLARAMLNALIGFSAATFFITMELDILFVLWGLCAAVIVEGLKHFPGTSFSLTSRDVWIVLCGGAGIIGVVYLIAVIEIF
jgi:O-antigen ligase